MRNRALLLAVALAIVPLASALAIDGFSTCHATGTTAIDISGLDTQDARMVSIITYPDALVSCQRDGLHGNALTACAKKTFRDPNTQDRVKTYANCKKGTLAVEYQPVPQSTYYQGPGRTHTDRFRFPVEPTCGGDGMAAISAFRTLCPSYEGKVELVD